LPEKEREPLMRRLLDYLLGWFEYANLEPHSRGEPRMELAQEERSNIDVAIAWAIEARLATGGLRLLERTEMYWGTNDPIAGRARLDALLAVAGDDVEPAMLARALRFRGATFDMVGRSDLSEAEYEKAVELLQSVGDESEAGHLRLRIANSAVGQGDLERASELAAAALESDPPLALWVLAQVAFNRGDADEGAQLAHEASEAAAEVGNMWWHGVTLLGAAEEQLRLGRLEGAGQDLLRGVAVLKSVRDLINLPIALAAGAALAAQLGDPARAGTLWGAAEADADRTPAPTTAASLAHYEPYLEPVRGVAFEEARLRGQALSLDEAVGQLLSDD
jgi:tetratricopeptide (TPR) repeat protein